MTEAALTLSEQKNHNLQELLSRVKAEREEQRDRQSRERKKEQEVQTNYSSFVLNFQTFLEKPDVLSNCVVKAHVTCQP